MWLMWQEGPHRPRVSGVKKLDTARLDVWVPTIIGTPIPQRPRVNTPIQTNILEKQVTAWLLKGVIEPIPLNAYRNNLVFVAKKSGAIRVCDDCTPINKVTQEFDWPLPNLQDLRHSIRGSSWFSRLDLKDAFFRIFVPAAHRLWTSFRCGNKQYQFKRMPFGLKTAPSVFQRFMDSHLASLGEGYFWYIDDILVHAETLVQLRMRVARLRRKLRAMECEINEEKSEYDKESLLMAGIYVSGGRVSPNTAKVQEIMATPAPTTKKDAQSALGLVSYLRDYIPLISHFTAILYPNKDGLRLPPDEYQRQWKRLLRHLASAVTSLRHWDKTKENHLYTDASGTGLGVILIQEGQVVALASRQLTPAETRYSATDREHIALVFAAKRFKLFLHQSIVATKVWSDHAALLTRKNADLTPKQARWNEIVKYWIPGLQHVKGLDNPADFISRWSVEIGGGVLKT